MMKMMEIIPDLIHKIGMESCAKNISDTTKVLGSMDKSRFLEAFLEASESDVIESSLI
jgi:ketol-acid reductoisomerase